MLSRSRRRAERLNEAASVIEKYARRKLGGNERRRRVRTAELHRAAPPVQAIVRGWKVRARLRWCGNIATLIQRWVRGMLGRRLARWQRERVVPIQAAARGMLDRIDYRRVRHGAIALQSAYRGMLARAAARAERADPDKVRRWELLLVVRAEVASLDGRLASSPPRARPSSSR